MDKDLNFSGVSIIICGYNSAKRIEKTLSFIVKQEVEKSITWEIIIVDNNSTDHTGRVAQNYLAGKISAGQVKIIKEPQLGLLYARKRGIEASNYPYLIFCDDDNWLSVHYVHLAFKILSADPAIGALGGMGIPAFENSPPKWFNQVRAFYAVGPQAKRSGEIIHPNINLFGAGLAIRKEIYHKIVESGLSFSLTGRSGDNLTAGDDTELVLGIRLLGFKIWYDERLVFHHYLPRLRLNWTYFKCLRENIIKASIVHKAYQDHLKNYPASTLFYWLTVLKHIVFDLPLKIITSIFGSSKSKIELQNFLIFLKYEIQLQSKYKKIRSRIAIWKKNLKP